MSFTKLRKIISVNLVSVLIVLNFIVSVACTNATEKVIIYAFTDVHGCLLDKDYTLDETNGGSLAQISQFIKEDRAKNPDVPSLIVCAGDTFQGNGLEEAVPPNRPHPVIMAFNQMGLNLEILGNHDIDMGLKQAKKIRKDFKGISLAGNLFTFNGVQPFASHTIITIKGKYGEYRIGFIGMTSSKISSIQTHTEQEINYYDADKVVKKSIAEIDAHTDALVGVFHMGEDNEHNMPNTGATEIAQKNSEFDVIIGGHTHQSVAPKNLAGTDVLFVQPGFRGRQVAKIEFNFEKNNLVGFPTASIFDLSEYKEDLEMARLLSGCDKMVTENLAKPIGEALDDLVDQTGLGDLPAVLTKETALTNLISGAVLNYALKNKKNPTSRVVSAVCVGKDAIIKKGQIKIADVIKSYNNWAGEVVAYTMNGIQLRQIMENYIATFFDRTDEGKVIINEKRDAFRYTSYDILGGINYTIDTSKTIGKRITRLEYLDGTPVEDQDLIEFATTAYRMRNLLGEGYLKGNPTKLYGSTDEGYGGDSCRNGKLVVDEIVKRKQISAKTCGRWEVL